MGLFTNSKRTPAADKATPPRAGLTPERQRELILQAEAQEAAERAAKADPIEQEDNGQWRRASEPEVPYRPTPPVTFLNAEWKPSKGIEAMEKMYPHSQPLTREHPPQQPRGVTPAAWRAIAVGKFGIRAMFWMTPSMRREIAEECYVLPEFTGEAMPLPTSTTSQGEWAAKRCAAAPSRSTEHKPPIHGTTFFTAAQPKQDGEQQQAQRPSRRTFFSGG